MGVPVVFPVFPEYMEWSNRMIAEGRSANLIAYLDAICMWLLPEEIGEITELYFDEMLAELEDEFDI